MRAWAVVCAAWRSSTPCIVERGRSSCQSAFELHPAGAFKFAGRAIPGAAPCCYGRTGSAHTHCVPAALLCPHPLPHHQMFSQQPRATTTSRLTPTTSTAATTCTTRRTQPSRSTVEPAPAAIGRLNTTPTAAPLTATLTIGQTTVARAPTVFRTRSSVSPAFVRVHSWYRVHVVSQLRTWTRGPNCPTAFRTLTTCTRCILPRSPSYFVVPLALSLCPSRSVSGVTVRLAAIKCRRQRHHSIGGRVHDAVVLVQRAHGAMYVG